MQPVQPHLAGQTVSTPGGLPGHQNPTDQATTEVNPQEPQNDAPSSCGNFLRSLGGLLVAVLCTCMILALLLAPLFLFP